MRNPDYLMRDGTERPCGRKPPQIAIGFANSITDFPPWACRVSWGRAIWHRQELADSKPGAPLSAKPAGHRYADSWLEPLEALGKTFEAAPGRFKQGQVVQFVTGDLLAYEHTAAAVAGATGDIFSLPLTHVAAVRAAEGHTF